jgi:hypothetical protein
VSLCSTWKSLSDRIRKNLQKIQDHSLRPEQCAQLVEAIRLADIPAELEKQIKMLQEAADEHSVRQDDQL